jgi:hypothetical protein
VLIVNFRISAANIIFSKQKMTSGCPATYSISFNDKILCFEFSPFEFSRNLVAIALPDKIILGLVGFPVRG